jgi:outer membrane protein assembly factor BamD (BamD/ComL family)
MPRINLANYFPGLAWACLLALSAGCAATSPLQSAGRANPPNSPNNQIPVTASVTETGRPPTNAVAPAYYSPPGGPTAPNYQGGLQQSYQNIPPQGNSYTPYASSATATTRYFDPSVMPVGATDVAPVGPPGPGPYDAGNAPGGPPNFAGPGPSGPITISPVSASDAKSNEDNEWSLEHLAPDYTLEKFKQAVGWGTDRRLAREAYDRGQALFTAKNYDAAAKEFYTASWRWPDSSMEEDSMFLEGEAYFFSDHYGEAQDSYVNLLKKHDNTRYLDTVVARLFAIADYWERLDQQSHHWPITPNPTDKTQPLFDTFGNAMACYAAVWTHDEHGPYADAALIRVANAHFRREEWEDAAEHYDMLRKFHPKSKYQKEAHLLELQAKMRIYQGPKYSVVPLNDAEEIGKQALKQFPGQLGAEEGRVKAALQTIVEERAEREWIMAQYYDKKAEYRAARMYYQVLVEKYPQTSFGQRARQRMQEIKDEPDEPTNHFQWLTAPFGDGK